VTDFAHLHLHSEYSLLDGCIRFKELVPYLKEIGLTACALTDHGNMCGAVEFYKAMKKEGLKPLVGIEAYCSDNPDDVAQEDKIKDNMHVVLLPKDNVGLKTLFKLISEANLHNFYYKPRIQFEKLAQLAGHCVVSTACLAGILSSVVKWDSDRRMWSDETNAAEEKISFLQDHFKEDLYLELQDWNDGTDIQPAWNEFLLMVSEKRNIECVITTDAHYLRETDYELHELLMALQLKQTLEEYKQGTQLKYGPYFWVKPPEEMLKSAKKIGCESAFWNTGKIADKCNVELELGTYYPPVFHPEKAKDYQDFLKWRKERGL